MIDAPWGSQRISCGKPWSHWRMAEAIRTAGQDFCAKFLVAPLTRGGGGHPSRTWPDRPKLRGTARDRTSHRHSEFTEGGHDRPPLGGQILGATPWLSCTGIGFPVAIVGLVPLDA